MSIRGRTPKRSAAAPASGAIRPLTARVMASRAFSPARLTGSPAAWLSDSSRGLSKTLRPPRVMPLVISRMTPEATAMIQP